MPLDPLPSTPVPPDGEPTIPVSVELSPHPSALVPIPRRRWVLRPGESMSFGRGSPCDIRLAHDPVDEHVSRRAGVVEHQGGDLVVRNESTKRRLIVKPAREPERVLRPGEATTCRPHREFLVAIDGRGGSHYVLHVSGMPGDDRH